MTRSGKRRVVVTGIGAVTPAGNSFADTWNGIVEGKCTAGPIQAFDASEFPCNFAYEVSGFKFDYGLVTEKERSFVNRVTEFAVQASAEALGAAAIGQGTIDPRRARVVLGVGMFCPDFSWNHQVFAKDKYDDPSLKHYVRYVAHVTSSIIARMLNAKGGATTVHTACASSGQALGEAFLEVAGGDADLVLTGGADSMINPIYLAGFNLLGALSRRTASPATAVRPFAADRDGFVLGEGACILVLEEYEHALRRGASIMGEICGYGVTESAYRITDLHPEGVGPVEAMALALADAGVKPEQVGYINAHGTSTYLNDQIEALSIKRVFGDSAPRVSSTKTMTGHMISAAGAIESAICVAALRHQVLPPSINSFERDPACDVVLTPEQTSAHQFEFALSNSIGFGGSNTAIVARRFDDCA